MSKQFDWHIAEGDNQPEQPDYSSKPPHGRHRLFWLITLLVPLLIFGGWGLAKYQLDRTQTRLRDQVQTVLDLERAALLAGDGDLFFALQADDPAWFAARLHPMAQARLRTGLRVTNVQAVGDYRWANVTWAEGDTVYQQVMFFKQAGEPSSAAGLLQHTPTAPDYWGRTFRMEAEWGQLAYPELDEPWAEEIAAFIGQAIGEICPIGCMDGRLPLTVVITPDQTETAVPHHLHIPSPRLLALNTDGRPADLFWQELHHRLENALTPATIRFAVPPQAEQLADYEAAAQAFMAANPHITVEIVALDSANPAPADLLAYDGAAFPLTESLLASGGVADLTDYVQTDPAFAQGDFYEQIWQGSWWHGRMWFVPHSGAMNVLYYDKAAYQAAEYPEPSPRWTWTELAQDMIIIANPYSQNQPPWGFLDAGNDTLFSYAFNWENDCTKPATVQCDWPLTGTAVAAALTWYQQMAGQPGQMPNLLELPAREQENLLLNWQSARRRAAIWVDSPTNYEFRLLLAPLGVVSFPGSNRFDGITPLRVSGHFISQQAENPHAVWEWLKFLSFQPPRPALRQVPARPSVAEASRFWQILPRELGNSMRIAFPFARPVRLVEQRYFTEAQVTAVLSGTATPAEAAQMVPPLRWFR